MYKCHIRWLLNRDRDEIVEIETRSSHHVQPWTRKDLDDTLRLNDCIGMVAEECSIMPKTIGYMIYELYKKEIFLLNFAVIPERQRSGIGTEIMNNLISKLGVGIRCRRTKISLRVRETNLPAQLFFRKMGFRAKKVIRNHYENGEDAFLMEYNIINEEKAHQFRPVNRMFGNQEAV